MLLLDFTHIDYCASIVFTKQKGDIVRLSARDKETLFAGMFKRNIFFYQVTARQNFCFTCAIVRVIL